MFTIGLSTRRRHCVQIQECRSNGIVLGETVPAEGKLMRQTLSFL